MSAKRAILIILDGWGLGQLPEADAIAKANTPVFDRLWSEYPHATLTTFGEQVGLPEGQMGNSEVGHMNIGAGRIVYQNLMRINKAISEGELAENETLQQAIQYAKLNGKAIHLMGLVSDGGVHSHISHLLGLVDIIENEGHDRTYIHAFTDGRDTDPQGGRNYLEQVLSHIEGTSTQIASVTGRYYAMDRDKRWERIKLAYDAMVHAKGELSSDLLSTMKERYQKGETDEFIQPIIVADDQGSSVQIAEDDVLICFNFRTDRPRQISTVLSQQDFPEHEMTKLSLRYLTMTRYDDTFQGIEVLFEDDNLERTMGEVLAEAGKTQVRIAETEKYAHVTFFFNGGREQPFQGERRLMIPSPQDVATYDLKPAMSAVEVTNAIVDDIKTNTPDFICLNYANSDMVGHTGIFEAAITAAETVDTCLGKLIEVAQQHGYEALIIADHGNSDFLVNADGSPNTAHTMNPVPCIYVHERAEAFQVQAGKLGDVAPSLLWMLGITPPPEMDGNLLIQPV